ncbi:MAG: glycoside hydrolase family 1 protein [Deltaproteobacteria bacterium]|nr:glycoside hydrolase family 1 protein [Deltaproteobacteria bacterium]
MVFVSLVFVAAVAFAVALVAVDLIGRLPRREPIVPPAADGPFAFPRGFLWGTATADHQIERAQADDWTVFERRAKAEGKQDRIRKGQMRPGHIGDVVATPAEWFEKKTDFDTHFDDDLALAAAHGHNAFRLSISWARLFPRAGMTTPDSDGVAFYERVFASLAKHGLQPSVTLFHFASPQWLWDGTDAQGRRGLESDDAVAHFAHFTRTVVDLFGAQTRHWCTLNEPMVWAVLGYLEGVFPPFQRRGLPAQINAVVAQLLRMHAAAYHAIKRGRPDAEVGIAHHVRHFVPWRNRSLLDRITAKGVDNGFIVDFLDAIETGVFRPALGGPAVEIEGLAGTQDYVGVNFYGRFYVRTSGPGKFEIVPHDPSEPGEEESDVGWAIDETSLAPQLVRFAARYKKPLYILENGIADAADDDVSRQRFLVRHVQAVWQAIEQGADVRGFFYWSLVDNFEWIEGFAPRFGLVNVDYAHGMRRRPRPSLAVYADIAGKNAVDAALWARFRRPPPSSL